MTADYGPGPWVGMVRGQTAVVLEPNTSPELILTLWDLLDKAPEVHEVLHAVTTGFGGSLTDMPSFGIIGFNGSLRVFLRGDMDLEIDGPDGGTAPDERSGLLELNGRNVSTWAERWLAEPGNFRLTIGGAPAEARWPLVEGVVQLGALAVTVSGTSPKTETEARNQGAQSAADVSPVSPGALTAREPHAASAAPSAASLTDPEPEPASEAAATMREEPSQAAPGLASPVPEFAELESPVTEGPAVDSALSNRAESNTAKSDSAASDNVATNSAGMEAAGAAVPGGADAQVNRAETGTAPDAVEYPAGSPSGDSEASAETVLGLPDEDEDSGYTNFHAADLQAAEPDPYEADLSEADAGQSGYAEQAQEMTGNYDHLWEKTVARSIEDAAVRDDPEEEDEPATETPAREAPAPEDADVLEPRTGPADVPAPASQPATPQPAADSGLIDSVPWQTSGSPAAPWVPSVPVPAQSVQPAPTSPAQPAQIWPAPPATAGQPPYAVPSFDEDHDGQTIMKSDLAGMVAHPAPVLADPVSGPMVLARVCAQDHANPPTYAQCASCGQQLPADAIQVPRPQLGVMRISTGEVVELNQSLVIGRQPSVSRVQGGGMPRLVQVASPSGDISRSHVEVRLEGWHVMLCDLKATNGTVLVRQGQPPRRLAQNEMAILLDGDVAELGDDISLRFEEIR